MEVLPTWSPVQDLHWPSELEIHFCPEGALFEVATMVRVDQGLRHTNSLLPRESKRGSRRIE